ncbi:uncharacterized protein LOC143056856 isoform X2 [Mytilus galloprovincialis]|uniref:uncharacterized protein LOC143056856 isoform X2 n=1 Tax=Mytilus galloprovincialis TaxID=29158 RepID=UPI003F7C72AC
MPKSRRNCFGLPYHRRRRRARNQLQQLNSLRKKALTSAKPEEFTVEVADSGVVIGTGTIHDSYWSVTIPEDGNHFDGDSNNSTTQDIFENEHTNLELEIDVDKNLDNEHCIQINDEEENSFEKINKEGIGSKEHSIIIDEEENSFETVQYVGIGNEMVSSESNELSRVISPSASYNDNNYNTVQTVGLCETVQYDEIGSEMVSSSSNELSRVVSPLSSYIDDSYNTVQTDGIIRITGNEENSSETVQYIEIGSERELSKNNELYRVVSPITSYIDNSHNTFQTDGVRITRKEQNSFETGQYVEIGSEMMSSGNNELHNVDSLFPSYNSYSAVLYNNNSYNTVQTDLGQQNCNDVSERNELGGVIAPVTLFNNNSYNTAQSDAGHQDYQDGSDTDSTVSNDFVTVKVELPDGSTELLETIPYEKYPTVQSEHAEIDLYGSHTDDVNIHNNKIMSESELFRITHNVNAIPDQSMPGTSTQSYIPANDHVQFEEGDENCKEWDIGMLQFVMETMKEQENTQSNRLLDKNIQKAKKKKVHEAKWKAGICSSNKCCPGCDTYNKNYVRKPPKTKKTKTTKTDSALGEEKSQSPRGYRRKFSMERCDFCPMVFRGAWPKYKKQNHIIAEHCSKDVQEELRKRKKKNEVVSEPKPKFVTYSKLKHETIRLNLEFPDDLYGMECIECNKVIREDHFRKFLKCTKCNYYSMCSRAYIEHMINTHGTKNRFTNKYVPCSSRFMECACGFVHIEGNKMAEHLLVCEYNQLSCKIVNSKEISSRHEDGLVTGARNIEKSNTETSSWKKKSAGFMDGVTLHEISKGKFYGSFSSKPLKKFRRHKCSICYAALKIRMDEQQRLQKAVLEVNEYHNYSKPAWSSPGANSEGAPGYSQSSINANGAPVCSSLRTDANGAPGCSPSSINAKGAPVCSSLRTDANGAPGCSPSSINANGAPVCSSLGTDANSGLSCSAPHTNTNGALSCSSPCIHANSGPSCSAPHTNTNGALSCSSPCTHANSGPSCSAPHTNTNGALSCSSPCTHANSGLSCSAPRTNANGGPACSEPRPYANGAPSCSAPRTNANGAPSCSSPHAKVNGAPSCSLPHTYGNRAPACSFPLIYGNGAPSGSLPRTNPNGAPSCSSPRTNVKGAPSCSLPRTNVKGAPSCSLPHTYGNRAPACSFPLIYGNEAAAFSCPHTYGNGPLAYSNPRTNGNGALFKGAPSLVSELDNVPSTSDDQHICDESHDLQVENDQEPNYPRLNLSKSFSQDWVSNKLFKQLKLKDTELNEQNKNKEKEEKCKPKRKRGKGEANKANPKRTCKNEKLDWKPMAKTIHNIKNRTDREVLAKLYHKLICCVNGNSSVNKQNKKIAHKHILKMSTDSIKCLTTESWKLELERKWLQKENSLLVEKLQTLQKK